MSEYEKFRFSSKLWGRAVSKHLQNFHVTELTAIRTFDLAEFPT